MDDRAEMGTGTLILYTASLIAAMYAVGALTSALTGLGQQSSTQGHAAMAEAATALQVTGVYGTRNSTASGVWDVRVTIELPDGASALDVTRLLLRHDDDNGVAHAYAHGAAALADGAAGSLAFNATWTRGAGGSTFVMAPSDHVTLHYNLDASELPTRTTARLTLTPEVGRPTTVELTTPGTFGTDAIVLLH